MCGISQRSPVGGPASLNYFSVFFFRFLSPVLSRLQQVPAFSRRFLVLEFSRGICGCVNFPSLFSSPSRKPHKNKAFCLILRWKFEPWHTWALLSGPRSRRNGGLINCWQNETHSCCLPLCSFPFHPSSLLRARSAVRNIPWVVRFLALSPLLRLRMLCQP